MSKFKERVLKAVKMIPKGYVASYGQIAHMVGVPRAAIQVGWVLHEHGDTTAWWRIINSKGYISTTCVEHDANMQKSLLEKDGVPVSKDLKVDISKYRYIPTPQDLTDLELESGYIQELMDKYSL